MNSIITGTGFSTDDHSFNAGVELATKALGGQQLFPHTLFFLFATPTHSVPELIRGIRSVTNEGVDVIGGTTIGVVTNDFLSYSGVMAGGAMLSSDEKFYEIQTGTSIKDRESEAGIELGKELVKSGLKTSDSMLLLYDCLKFTHEESAHLLFNLSNPFLDGILSEIKAWPQTVGGVGVIGDMTGAYSCAIWVNDLVQRHGLAAIFFNGRLKMDTVILQGTSPSGGYYTITKTDQNKILEIDHMPALEKIDEMTGHTMTWDDYPLFITLGVNNGDKFGEFVAENYSSRFCLDIDREQKALIMMEDDLQEGMEVQLMRRELDFAYIKPKVDLLKSKIGKRRPVFAFYIDCIGRVSQFSGMPEEESLEVIRHMGDIPLFGIFSGVEIANVANGVKPLDWTGVLCLFSEE